MSRALSVHQGKGVTDTEAQLGALLEALESHSAESFDRYSRVGGFLSLPSRSRAPCLGDFATDRQRPPSEDAPARWVDAEDLLEGGTLWIPWDCVSLDLTRYVPSLFDRASNGVAAGASREEAIVTALQEFIERDAVTEWRAGGMTECMKATLDPGTIPYDWFQYWSHRIEAAGAWLRSYLVPSITGMPVFACEISDLGKDSSAYRSMQGRGCHPLPEIALFKALAEAIQGRATYIAGAREDLAPADYAPSGRLLAAFGLPLPPGMSGVDFSTVVPGPSGLDALGEALSIAGYGRIAVIELASYDHICVVRAFVCGLGSIARRRRPPAVS